MDGLADIERRIDALCRCASSRPVDPDLLADLEDLLEAGYVQALKADALAAHLVRCSGAPGGHAGGCTVADEARRLRASLRLIRSLVVRTMAARADVGESGT